ncbi:MAG: C4-type zinc ribbon domain-containing protein [Pseudomonadota bacterium]
MRDQLILLYELQQLDHRIRDCEIRLRGIPLEAAATKESLDKSQGSLTELLARQDVNESERRAMERDLAADREKLRKWEARLNDIRNSREFAALSREIEGLKRQNRDTEEKILEHMQQGEEIAKQVATLSTQVDQHATTYHELHLAADDQSIQVRAEMEQIGSARGSITSRLQAPILKKYEFIRQRRDGIGLVVLADGTCQGCHMQLPPQMYNELQRGDRLEVCPSCQRILFYEQLAQRTTEDQAGIQP